MRCCVLPWWCGCANSWLFWQHTHQLLRWVSIMWAAQCDAAMDCSAAQPCHVWQPWTSAALGLFKHWAGKFAWLRTKVSAASDVWWTSVSSQRRLDGSTAVCDSGVWCSAQAVPVLVAAGLAVGRLCAAGSVGLAWRCLTRLAI